MPVTLLKRPIVQYTALSFLSLIIFLWSCRPTNIKSVSTSNNEITNVKLIEMKRLNSVTQIKSVNEKFDTIFLISPNKKEYAIDTSKFISLRLMKVDRFRVGTMEAMGAYLIIGNGTLWSGESIKHAPMFYRIIEP